MKRMADSSEAVTNLEIGMRVLRVFPDDEMFADPVPVLRPGIYDKGVACEVVSTFSCFSGTGKTNIGSNLPRP